MSDQETAEGSVSFPSRPLHSYRYKITTKSDSVNFWLEDRQTKNQWESGELKVSEFVNAKNVIPQASLADYISCFQNCLETALPEKKDTESECTCDLAAFGKDSWSLRFVLALKLYASVWRPEYQVTLKPIPLQQIDILAAQLRDLQEEVAQLRSGSNIPINLSLETTQQAGSGGTLVWRKSVAGDNVEEQFSIDSSGKIRFLVGGIYLINLTVLHQTMYDYSCLCEILRDGALLCSFTGSTNSNTSYTSFFFVRAVAMKGGQHLTVVNKSKNYVSASTSMSIVLLQ